MGTLEDRALELFDELCDLSREVQVRRLQEIGAEDPGLRADVEELLEGDRLSGEGLEQKARVPASLLPLDRQDSRDDEALGIVQRLISRTRPYEHYRIEGEVGRGGMGAVLEVWDEDLERRLAMKVIAGEEPRASAGVVAGDSRAMTRFLDEARVTSQLDHPGIVPVHELGLDSQGRVYFTMKLVRGRTLQEVFELVAGGKEDWSQTRALGVLLKVCEALAYAHSKDVVHRDLKPANVMVGRFGEVYVMDWGVARVRGKEDVRDLRPRQRASSAAETGALALESPVVTMDGTVVGTPYYMPPEQAAGRMAEVDARSDVYALGAMLYQLLVGRPPYAERDRGLSPHAVLARVLEGAPHPVQSLAHAAPAEICAICEKAMARMPQDRYGDTAALADDLRAYLEGRVVRAYEAGAWAEARKWVKRNRALASASGAAVMLLVVGLVASLVLKAQSDRNAQLAGENAGLALSNADEARRQADAAKENEEQAQAALRLAEGARLLALARETLERDPEQALLLAIEGAGRKPGPDANDLLVESLDAAGLLTTVQGHEGQILAMVATSDGKRLATAGQDSTVVLWDLERRELLQRLGRHSTLVVQLAFSKDATFLGSLSRDGEIALWNLTTGRCVRRIPGFAWPESIAFEGDTTRLAVQSPTGFLRAWDASTGREVEPARAPVPGFPLEFTSPDGRFGLVVRPQQSVQVRELSSAKVAHGIVTRGTVLSCASFSFDGRWLATAEGTATVAILDTMSWEVSGAIVSYDQPAHFVRFSPDGHWLVSATFSEHSLSTWAQGPAVKSVRVFDASTRKAWLSVNPRDSLDGFSAACFEPGCRFLLVARLAGTVAWVPLDPLSEASRIAPRRLSSIELKRFGVVRPEREGVIR